MCTLLSDQCSIIRVLMRIICLKRESKVRTNWWRTNLKLSVPIPEPTSLLSPIAICTISIFSASDIKSLRFFVRTVGRIESIKKEEKVAVSLKQLLDYHLFIDGIYQLRIFSIIVMFNIISNFRHNDITQYTLDIRERQHAELWNSPLTYFASIVMCVQVSQRIRDKKLIPNSQNHLLTANFNFHLTVSAFFFFLITFSTFSFERKTFSSFNEWKNRFSRAENMKSCATWVRRWWRGGFFGFLSHFYYSGLVYVCHFAIIVSWWRLCCGMKNAKILCYFRYQVEIVSFCVDCQFMLVEAHRVQRLNGESGQDTNSQLERMNEAFARGIILNKSFNNNVECSLTIRTVICTSFSSKESVEARHEF